MLFFNMKIPAFIESVFGVMFLLKQGTVIFNQIQIFMATFIATASTNSTLDLKW